MLLPYFVLSSEGTPEVSRKGSMCVKGSNRTAFSHCCWWLRGKRGLSTEGAVAERRLGKRDEVKAALTLATSSKHRWSAARRVLCLFIAIWRAQQAKYLHSPRWAQPNLRR
jgi:hypothetical protein